MGVWSGRSGEGMSRTLRRGLSQSCRAQTVVCALSNAFHAICFRTVIPEELPLASSTLGVLGDQFGGGLSPAGREKREMR